MSVEQRQIIDMLSVEDDANEVVMIITDHLPWMTESNFDHASLLQDKFNTYVAFVESGELEKKYPQYRGKKILIRVIGKYKLSEKAKEFYKLASKVAESGGFRLEFKLSEV